MSETFNPQLEQEYQQLEADKARFDEAMKVQNVAEAKRLQQVLDAQIATLSEKLNPLERKLELKKQYEAQVGILQKTGLIEKLSTGNFGLRGIDGQEHPLPTYQEVSQRSREKKELLGRKSEQGFRKMLIVPEGRSIAELKQAYEQVLLNHDQAGTLLDTTGNQLKLDRQTPVWQSDSYQNADIDGQLVYGPQEFSQNHQGQTKKERLAQNQAFRIIFIEDLPDLPAAGQGNDISGRAQIEANQQPNEYLKKPQEEQYQGENGLTPESWLTYAITSLEEKNQQIDDYQGQGKACYLTGAYFTSGGVPIGYWGRGGSRAFLNRSGPDSHDSGGGFRPSVEI